MTDKLFVIAIGGTGMRLLESFVHLCAIGMFDGQEIDILTIDTDNGNGNKDRTENLLNLYNKIKTSEGKKGGTPNRQTFFSAKLNLYRFYTDYSGNRSTYRNLANIMDGDADNEDLAGLFLDKDTVQSFNLEHGYRAQTHLGSMLMYHGIIEAAKNSFVKGDQALPQEKDLNEFLTKLMNASDARVFIFGSVFGGTGASSIPVIPDALTEAVTIISDGKNTLDSDHVKFGASLLTDYFSFPNPSGTGLDSEKVIANSNNFALNSQAALDFYRKDPTVKRFYRRLYHVGWPRSMREDISNGKLLTGGSDQKNPCHVTELMCAMGAFDFFTLEELPRMNNAENMPCFYRTIEASEDGKNLYFTAESFAEKGSTANMFVEHLAQFFSFANVMLASEYGAYRNLSTVSKEYGLYKFIQDAKRQKVPGFDMYSTIEPLDLAEIEEYLRLFAFSINNDNKTIVPGWIYQVKNSVKGKFIFANGFVETEKGVNSLGKIPGKLFDQADQEKNWAGDEGGLMSQSSYSKFKDGAFKSTTITAEQSAGSIKEQFIAFMYNAVRNAHNFSNAQQQQK